MSRLTDWTPGTVVVVVKTFYMAHAPHFQVSVGTVIQLAHLERVQDGVEIWTGWGVTSEDKSRLYGLAHTNVRFVHA